MIWGVRILFVLVGLLLAAFGDVSLALLGALLFLLGLFDVWGWGESLLSKAKTSALRRKKDDVGVAQRVEDLFAKIDTPLVLLYGRRSIYWWIAGSWVFFQISFFVTLRYVLIEKNTLSVLAMSANQGLALLLIVWIGVILIFSFPLGFFIKYLYFQMNGLSLPVYLSKLDRVYDALLGLAETYFLDYEVLFGQELENTKESLSNARKIPAWIAGPEAYFYPDHIRPHILSSAERNWGLFKSVWGEVVAGHKAEMIDLEANHLEDKYVLLGVFRIATVLAGLLFWVYELARMTGGSASVWETVLSLLLSTLIVYLIFMTLSITRVHTGEDAVSYKINYLRENVSTWLIRRQLKESKPVLAKIRITSVRLARRRRR